MTSYATLAELKDFLHIPTADTEDDSLGQVCLDAATEAIDLALGTTDAQLSPVPSSIKLACELQASRWFKRREAPFGVLGSPEFGNYSRLLERLDPDVVQLIDGYGHRKRYGTAF